MAEESITDPNMEKKFAKALIQGPLWACNFKDEVALGNPVMQMALRFLNTCDSRSCHEDTGHTFLHFYLVTEGMNHHGSW